MPAPVPNLAWKGPSPPKTFPFQKVPEELVMNSVSYPPLPPTPRREAPTLVPTLECSGVSLRSWVN